jgi:hypothetical protein
MTSYPTWTLQSRYYHAYGYLVQSVGDTRFEQLSKLVRQVFAS